MAWCPLCERATAHEKRDMKFEEILVEDDDDQTDETTSETSTSAGEDDITFLEVLQTQKTALTDTEDEVSVIFEDTSTSQESSPNMKPRRPLKRICPERTSGSQKKQKLEEESTTLKTNRKDTGGAQLNDSIASGELQQVASPSPSSVATRQSAGSEEEGMWLRDWLGLPNGEDGREKSEEASSSDAEGTKESQPPTEPFAGEEENAGPEMEGSGLTAKQRAHAQEKEKRKKEVGGQSPKQKEVKGKLPKGYVLESLNKDESSDSKLTRQCLDQMFDDDDSDTDEPSKVGIKKEAEDTFQTHSIGCVQIDQDVLREMNLKVELVQNDYAPSQPSLANPTDGDDGSPSKQDLKPSSLRHQSKCLLDTGPHTSVFDFEEDLKNVEIKMGNATGLETPLTRKASLSSDDCKKEKLKDGKNNSGTEVEKKERVETKQDSPGRGESEDAGRSFWAQYYCTNCQWLLGGAEGLLQHNRCFGFFFLDKIQN